MEREQQEQWATGEGGGRAWERGGGGGAGARRRAAPLPDHSPATPRADGAGPDRRRSAGSDGWPADGGAYTEDYESESPRSFDSPRSADSLDDVILSLSQSVAPAAPLKPSWSDPRGDGAP